MPDAFVVHEPCRTIDTATLALVDAEIAKAGPDVPVRLAWLRAPDDNSDDVRISGPLASLAAGGGFPLAPGESFGPIPVANLNQISISGVAPDGVRILWGR